MLLSVFITELWDREEQRERERERRVYICMERGEFCMKTVERVNQAGEE